ncbi:deoxyribodipyrimidine photo-lyase-like [Tubulanus polymorphus]|uniref:deoxyribodipyrimidine photo-lyase-like n=1 Tax=Tubulanus polymorphus TaxID=672921 RepID=UPI003DA587D6
MPPPKKKAKTDDGSSNTAGAAGAAAAAAAAGGTDIIERLELSRSQFAKSIADFKFNKKRVRVLSKAQDIPDASRGVVYWMARDQRLHDNWAVLYAQRLALKLKLPLHVCFCLVPKFLEATIRHYGFMLSGLREIERDCRRLNISFHLLDGYAKDVLPDFVRDNQIGAVITDFSPLREPQQWVKDVTKLLPKNIAFCQVDAHNVVPCWEASPKLEYGARTIRRKIQDQLGEYLTQFPSVAEHPHSADTKPEPIDWDSVKSGLQVDRTVGEVDWAVPGSTDGLRTLDEFCKIRLKHFGSDRNNPNKKALSNLSPWIHFGQISVQRCVLEVNQYRGRFKESVDAYVEESVIRRELADNFCYYNPKYDSIEGAYDWAKTSLKLHEKDERPYLYTRQELETAKTHDDLWNAAQLQMVKEGKMHGFLRMYWAKKILEWTESPKIALETAIYLNDRYELDGRDPNGFVGCAWSICGIHDQGWAERSVFGKIRYMNYAGCKRKFDVAEFVRKYKAVSYPYKKKKGKTSADAPDASPGSLDKFVTKKKRSK